eukprot:Pompholyxophrys_punicea_v1_NODE_17_length_5980_cov_2.985654.p11 type:complete len:125 gc:universal NODE_17_length_5980_cov_2.985654:221-595(+)
MDFILKTFNGSQEILSVDSPHLCAWCLAVAVLADADVHHVVGLQRVVVEEYDVVDHAERLVPRHQLRDADLLEVRDLGDQLLEPVDHHQLVLLRHVPADEEARPPHPGRLEQALRGVVGDAHEV